MLDPPQPGRGWVVCVHGLGCSHRYFAPVARQLAADVGVAAPDLPGFGHTPGPRTALDIRELSLALADWLGVTGRGGATLLANSGGCQVVADLAMHSPELLGPVVLNGPSVDPSARTGPAQLGRLLRTAVREPPALIAVLAPDYLRAGPRRLLATSRHMLGNRIEHSLPHVHSAAIVVRGSRDPIAPREWANRAAALLPAGRCVEVPGAAHALNFSAPQQLAHLTRRLLYQQE